MFSLIGIKTILFVLELVAFLCDAHDELFSGYNSIDLQNQTRHLPDELVRKSAEDGKLVLSNSYTSFRKSVAYPSLQDHCKLTIPAEDQNEFRYRVLKKDLNYVFMKFTFQNVNWTRSRYIVTPTKWVWTYDGDQGGYRFLYWPLEFGVWSFGILFSHAYGDIPIRLKGNGRCDLTIGNRNSNLIIANALGDMTDKIAEKDEKYNASYWCYNRRKYITPNSLYYLCRYIVCPVEAVNRECCKFKSKMNSRFVVCNYHPYFYDSLWWVLPFVLGSILFAYSPLIVMHIATKLYDTYHLQENTGRIRLLSHDEMAFARNDDPGLPDEEITDEDFNSASRNEAPEENIRRENSRKDYRSASSSSEIVDVDSITETHPEIVFLTDRKPVSLVSTVFSPCVACLLNYRTVISRVVRAAFPFCTLFFIVIQLIVYGHYLTADVKELVEKETPLGFQSMISGFHGSRKVFFPRLGGPYVVLGLYLIFGASCLACPRDLSAFLSCGISENSGVSASALSLDIRSKEILSSILIERHRGYVKIYNILLAHFYLLLNPKFWIRALKIMKQRMDFYMGKYCKCCIIFLPLYLVFCILEIGTVIIYYSLPIFCYLAIVFRAYFLNTYNQILSRRPNGKFIKAFAYVCSSVVGLIMLFVIYVFCAIFLDAFLFLSRMAVFTYTGVIVYPRVSYGYMILIFMSLYYLSESVNNYGTLYFNLLRVTIDVCENITRKTTDITKLFVYYRDGLKGIPNDLFEFVVERIRPRRIQVFQSFLLLSCTVFILVLSMEILLFFNSFKDLSLIVHVFFALFICAIPLIVSKVGKSRRNREMNYKLRRDIRDCVREYRKRKRYGRPLMENASNPFAT